MSGRGDDAFWRNEDGSVNVRILRENMPRIAPKRKATQRSADEEKTRENRNMSEKQHDEKAKAEHEPLTVPVWLRPGGQHVQDLRDIPDKFTMQDGTVVATKKGKKFDDGKPDLSLVPRGLVEGCARAMMFGVGKYGRDNWRGGFDDSRLLAACLRHIMAYTNGERVDRESGLCHLDHAAFSLAVVLDQLRARDGGSTVGHDDIPSGCA